MSTFQTYLIGGIVAVAALALAAARFSLFQRDLRRSISFGVGLLSLLTILLSINVLVVGIRLRDAVLADSGPGTIAQWNGLVLGAILLLLLSVLSFFFAVGVFIWSLSPPYGEASPPAPKALRSPFEGITLPPQSLNPYEHR